MSNDTEADFIICTHDDVIGVTPDDVVVFTLGSPGYFTDADAARAAEAIGRLGGVPLHLTIGGYDDDPRDVFDIPEARNYVGRFVLWALEHGLDEHWNLSDGSKHMLAVCAGFNPRNLTAAQAAFLGVGKPQAAVFDEIFSEANASRAASPPSGNRQARRAAERQARKRKP